jgi:hypothetical protein
MLGAGGAALDFRRISPERPPPVSPVSRNGSVSRRSRTMTVDMSQRLRRRPSTSTRGRRCDGSARAGAHRRPEDAGGPRRHRTRRPLGRCPHAARQASQLQHEGSVPQSAIRLRVISAILRQPHHGEVHLGAQSRKRVVYAGLAVHGQAPQDRPASLEALAPSARGLITSVPRRTPPSISTGARPSSPSTT